MGETVELEGRGFHLVLDGRANIASFYLGEMSCEPALGRTFYEIDGKAATVSDVGQGQFSLTADSGAGTLAYRLDKEIGVGFTPEAEESGTTLAIVLSFPPEAVFHLPEKYNAGRKIDRDMPFRHRYAVTLSYNFFLVESQGMTLRFMVRQTEKRYPTLLIERHPSLFTITFQWHLQDEAFITLFPSVEAAVNDYHAWLETALDTVKLTQNTDLPGWIHDVKLVLTLDMMRSDGQIAHNYEDVVNLAGELARIGCPKETLFYLPGSNGAYDSLYPDHGPHEELGGERGFRAMIEALHAQGFRAMLHANAWGLDPCHPEVDRYLRYVLKDDAGNYHGWQTGGKIWGKVHPACHPLKFTTDKCHAEAPDGGNTVTFSTVYFPDFCEALVTFGGFTGDSGRIKATVGRRSYLSPPHWFESHEEYALPFPFLMEEGVNRMTVSCEKGLPRSFWYRVRYCFYFEFGCTYPILRADTENPDWVNIFVEKISTVVRTYDIDAVHIDATHYERDHKILEALKAELPDVPMSGEELESFGDLAYFAFSQNAVLNLLTDAGRATVRRSRHYLPDRQETVRRRVWLDKSSPVCRFVSDYIYCYPHLCAPDGFVPVGKVCSIFPPSKLPEDGRELRNLLRRTVKLGAIPGLRLNYRQYGLDNASRMAIQECAESVR
jgi:hypothetical protein